MEAIGIKPYYSHGGVTLYHGDCLELMPSLTFDVIVTDPPYGIGWKRSKNAARSSKAHSGIANDKDTTARDRMLALAPDVPAVVFGSFYAPQPLNVKQVFVWEKPADAGVVGSTTGFRRDAEPIFLAGPWPQRTVRWSGVLRSLRQSIAHVAKETGHPHTKPVDLMRVLVDRCPPGVILDPFAGSGSTLRAAKDNGREAIGIELEEKYCEIIADRMRQEVLF